MRLCELVVARVGGRRRERGSEREEETPNVGNLAAAKLTFPLPLQSQSPTWNPLASGSTFYNDLSELGPGYSIRGLKHLSGRDLDVISTGNGRIASTATVPFSLHLSRIGNIRFDPRLITHVTG